MTEPRTAWAQICKGYRYDYTTGTIHGDLSIQDIANTMGNIPRYNGWTDTHVWCLASHTCLVAEILAADHTNPLGLVWYGLHHDDHEVFSGDLIRPLLDALPEVAYAAIKELQANAQSALMRQLGMAWLDAECTELWEAKIKAADLAALEAERRYLFNVRLEWVTEKYVDPKMLKDAERIIRGDFGRIYYGQEAADRFVARHKALEQLVEIKAP